MCRVRANYAGVATFCRQETTPVFSAEEGLSGRGTDMAHANGPGIQRPSKDDWERYTSEKAHTLMNSPYAYSSSVATFSAIIMIQAVRLRCMVVRPHKIQYEDLVALLAHGTQARILHRTGSLCFCSKFCSIYKIK